MNIHVSETEAKKRAARIGLAIADGDIHPALPDPKAIYPYLSQRWRDHMDTYGMIPLSLIRWEMTGRDDEIKKLW